MFKYNLIFPIYTRIFTATQLLHSDDSWLY